MYIEIYVYIYLYEYKYTYMHVYIDFVREATPLSLLSYQV